MSRVQCLFQVSTNQYKKIPSIDQRQITPTQIFHKFSITMCVCNMKPSLQSNMQPHGIYNLQMNSNMSSPIQQMYSIVEERKNYVLSKTNYS